VGYRGDQREGKLATARARCTCALLRAVHARSHVCVCAVCLRLTLAAQVDFIWKPTCNGLEMTKRPSDGYAKCE
jgi:hypothetical protein